MLQWATYMTGTFTCRWMVTRVKSLTSACHRFYMHTMSLEIIKLPMGGFTGIKHTHEKIEEWFPHREGRELFQLQVPVLRIETQRRGSKFKPVRLPDAANSHRGDVLWLFAPWPAGVQSPSVELFTTLFSTQWSQSLLLRTRRTLLSSPPLVCICEWSLLLSASLQCDSLHSSLPS